MATFRDPAPVLQWPHEAHLLTPGSLYRPSSYLTMASLVPAPASLQEAQMSSTPGHKIQAQNVHKSASEGPAPAFRWPLQAQLLSPDDFYRLCFYFWLCLEAQLLPRYGLSSCQRSSSQPLQAQLLLPATGLLRPSPAHASGRPPQAQDLTSSGPRQAQPPASGKPAQAQPLSQQTLHAQLSPDCGLPRPELLLPFGSSAGPRSCLPVVSLGPAHSSRGTAFPGPAFTFWRPFQAPNFLRPTSPGPVAASRPPIQAQLLLFPAAAAGRAPASRQPPWARLRPSSRSAAFVGPKRPEAGPHGGLSRPGSGPPTASPRPRLPPVSLSRPSSSSGRPPQDQDMTSSRPRHSKPVAALRPAQAQPLRPSGLSTPSSRLTAASPGQSSSCLSAAPPGPAPSSPWPR
nr:LOW QUALITY PROTEIN: putative uncharacterized protein FLJ44672 [Macaca fascicularis]